MFDENKWKPQEERQWKGDFEMEENSRLWKDYGNPKKNTKGDLIFFIVIVIIAVIGFFVLF